MRPPQVQRRGSASKIFLIRRAHVLRASLEKSELSCSGSVAAGKPALSPSAGATANPGAVGIGAVKSLTMASRIRDMRRNAVNPLERIQLDRGCAGPGIGRCFQNQAAVVEFLQRIHGQYGAGDISGLRFQGGDFGGFDRRSGINRKSRMHPGQQILHESSRKAVRPGADAEGAGGGTAA